MARRRFFVDQVRNGAAEISGEDAHHLTRVLRVEAGQRYEISDNRAVYLAEIESARRDRVRLRVIEPVPLREPAVRLTLVAALFKFDHFEWLVEKATELGVDTIIPFEAARTERGLFQAAGKRSERWRRIAQEASQQSRRDRLPAIEEAVTLDVAIATPAAVLLLLDEEPGAQQLLAALPAERTAGTEVAIALGPEGGWTGAEREAFLAAAWRSVSIGPQILRAETAGIAALAIVSAAWTA